MRNSAIPTIATAAVLVACGCSSGLSPSRRDGALDQSSLDAPMIEAQASSDGAADLRATTPTELCQAIIRANCRRGTTCMGAINVSDCDRFANLCPDYYFPPGLDRRMEDVARCGDASLARTCTDFVLAFLPAACAFDSALPAGSACSYSTQCLSGFCTGDSPSCMACVSAGSAPIGGACNDSRDCQPGSFCHIATGVCTDVGTIVHASEGDPCDLGATPAVGCVSDLLCVAPPGKSTGTCQRAPGPGQPCVDSGGFHGVCAVGSICTARSYGTCELIGACGDSACDDGSYCQASDRSCHTLAKVGEGCANADGSLLPPCLASAVCVSSTGLCTLPGNHGDTCDGDHPCAALLVCSSGICRLPGELGRSCPNDGGT